MARPKRKPKTTNPVAYVGDRALPLLRAVRLATKAMQGIQGDDEFDGRLAEVEKACVPRLQAMIKSEVDAVAIQAIHATHRLRELHVRREEAAFGFAAKASEGLTQSIIAGIQAAAAGGPTAPEERMSQIVG